MDTLNVERDFTLSDSVRDFKRFQLEQIKAHTHSDQSYLLIMFHTMISDYIYDNINVKPFNDLSMDVKESLITAFFELERYIAEKEHMKETV